MRGVVGGRQNAAGQDAAMGEEGVESEPSMKYVKITLNRGKLRRTHFLNREQKTETATVLSCTLHVNEGNVDAQIITNL